MSVLAGLVSLQGSGNYLKNDKKSAKASQITLLHSVITKSEEINIFDAELEPIIDLNAINFIDATHIVVSIDWGANCTITIDYSNQEEEGSTKVEGDLEAAMEEISQSIKGKGAASYEGKNIKDGQNFSFSSNCDIVPKNENLPTTAQEAINFIKKLPASIQESNNGKGRPLSYLLVPISRLVERSKISIQYDIKLKLLQEGTIDEFVRLFEDISLVKQELNDIYRVIDSRQSYLLDDDFNKISDLKNNFEFAESGLKAQLTLFCQTPKNFEIFNLCNPYIESDCQVIY